VVINKKGSAAPAGDVQGNIGSRGDPKPLGGPLGKGICLQLLLPPDMIGVHFVCWHSILHASFAMQHVAHCIKCMLYLNNQALYVL